LLLTASFLSLPLFNRVLMGGVLATLYAPLEALGEVMGLSPFLALLVVSMLATGSYVQWQFQHANHDHHDD